MPASSDPVSDGVPLSAVPSVDVPASPDPVSDGALTSSDPVSAGVLTSSDPVSAGAERHVGAGDVGAGRPDHHRADDVKDIHPA